MKDEQIILWILATDLLFVTNLLVKPLKMKNKLFLIRGKTLLNNGENLKMMVLFFCDAIIYGPLCICFASKQFVMFFYFRPYPILLHLINLNHSAQIGCIFQRKLT